MSEDSEVKRRGEAICCLSSPINKGESLREKSRELSSSMLFRIGVDGAGINIPSCSCSVVIRSLLGAIDPASSIVACIQRSFSKLLWCMLDDVQQPRQTSGESDDRLRPGQASDVVETKKGS